MTATDKFVPISQDLAKQLIDLLKTLSDYPAQRHRAADLLTQLGKSCEIAGTHRYAGEMHATELLEAIAQASGRHFENVPSVAAVAAAKAALSEMVPALGGNVVELRAPTRDTQREIDAATTRAVADAPAPLSAILITDGKQHGDPFDMWVVPQIGASMQVAKHYAGDRLPRAKRVRVLDVVHVSARTVEIHISRVEAIEVLPKAQVGP